MLCGGLWRAFQTFRHVQFDVFMSERRVQSRMNTGSAGYVVNDSSRTTAVWAIYVNLQWITEAFSSTDRHRIAREIWLKCILSFLYLRYIFKEK